jgi:hypothetical protein
VSSLCHLSLSGISISLTYSDPHLPLSLSLPEEESATRP